MGQKAGPKKLKYLGAKALVSGLDVNGEELKMQTGTFLMVQCLHASNRGVTVPSLVRPHMSHSLSKKKKKKMQKCTVVGKQMDDFSMENQFHLEAFNTKKPSKC